MPSRPARARALRLRGFRLAAPPTLPVSSSCPEAESPPWAAEPLAAQVLPGLAEQREGWTRVVSLGPASPLVQAHGPKARPNLALAHCLTAAGLPTTGPLCHRPEDRDLRPKSEACAMAGPQVGAALGWRPMRVALRLGSSRRCHRIPWRRRPSAVLAQQPGRAPRPTPLDWSAGPVSAPSGCRPQSAGIFPPGLRVPKEQFPRSQLACLPQASELVVRPTSAHPIQRVRPPGAASEEVRVTCGSISRIHDVSALRYDVTLRGHSHPRLDVVAISPCVGQGVCDISYATQQSP